MHRVLAAALLAIAAALPVSAATVSERSPFTQGQWWDPTRSGNGFELFNVGNQAMALWFTFDDARNPVWYTAQGELGTSWTLLKHHWAGLQRGAVVPVGTLKITFRDDSQADAEFTLNGRSGTWRIEPFNPGAKTNEVDHSGSYYDPANPGWGFTLTEQGEVIGGVLYTYTQFGFPTWVAGFARNSGGSVPVVSVRGSCPGCPPSFTDRFSAGRIEIELLSEREASIRAVLDEPIARGLNIDGTRLVQLGRPDADRPADRRLARFASVQSLRAYLEAVMRNMAFGGAFTGGVPQADMPERPVTLQGPDVDGCERVKSSGRFIYTFGHDGVSRNLAHLRVAEVGGDGIALDLRADTVPLASGVNTPTLAAALCLGTDTLASVAGTQPYSSFSPRASAVGYMKGRTYVEIFSLADPARPASRWWAEFDGHVLTSFRIGERLYVVMRHAPTVQGLDYRFLPSSADMNREVLVNAPLSMLTPQVRPNGGEAVALLSPASIHLVPPGARRRADYMTVVAIDLREARIVDALAILGPAEGVRLSGNDLYLTGGLVPGSGIGNLAQTRIYRIRLGVEAMEVAATGLVEGFTRGSLDAASDGRLRVLSGLANGAARLSILEPGFAAPEFLRVVSTLPNSSRPAPLDTGIFRFAGDRLYLANAGVLTIVALSDPYEPQIAGALSTRGPVESLHPMPEGRIVVTGREVSFFGLPSDLHVTAYDVRDPQKPAEIQRLRIGPSSVETALPEEPQALSQVLQADGTVSLAFPASLPPPASGPAVGVVHLELRHPRSLSAGLARLPDLRTPGARFLFPGSRALFYPAGLIYVEAGRFWRQDNTGNVTGPF